MKYIRLFFFVIPLFVSAPTSANGPHPELDINEDITNPGTGTFPVEDSKIEAQEEQIRMEKDEPTPDGFGEDKYNKNAEPQEEEDDDFSQF